MKTRSNKLLGSLLFLATCGIVAMAPHTKADENKPQSTIHFPKQPKKEVGLPKKGIPENVATITDDKLYVIGADEEYIMLTSPTGHVAITKEFGPFRWKGIFWDGNGKLEVREYKNKFVYTIEPIASGKCELIAFPAGAKEESQVERRRLDVRCGQSPQPPPIPPNPEPKPEPSPSPQPGPGPQPAKDKEFWIVVVHEADMTSPETAAIISNTKFWKSLEARGHNFRIYDEDNAEAQKKNYTRHAAKVGLPAIIVVDKSLPTGSKPVRAEKLPASTDAIQTLIKGLGGK